MSTRIVFIDSRVTDYQTLIDSLTEPAEVFILDGASDGLAQIAARLQGRSADLDVTQPNYLATLVGNHTELSLAQFGM